MAQTTVPTSAPTDQPTRRTMIGRLACAGATAATPALGSTLAADPHLRWELQLRDIYDRWMNAIDVSDAVVGAAIDAYWEKWSSIVETEPRTMAGLAAQLRTIVHSGSIFDDLDLREEAVLLRVAAALDAFGGRA